MRSLLFVWLAACGGGTTSPTTPTTPTATVDDPACPVSVAGTSVSVEDSDTGAALVFVTTGDVADLRRRTTLMAEKHNEFHAAMGPLPDGKDVGGGHEHHHDHGGDHSNHANHGQGGSMIGVHSKAATAEVEGGVKLAFIANSPDVGKLQSELRMHAKHYAAGTCGMK